MWFFEYTVGHCDPFLKSPIHLQQTVHLYGLLTPLREGKRRLLPAHPQRAPTSTHGRRHLCQQNSENRQNAKKNEENQIKKKSGRSNLDLLGLAFLDSTLRCLTWPCYMLPFPTSKVLDIGTRPGRRIPHESWRQIVTKERRETRCQRNHPRNPVVN
jgi:hypothetical protein